MSVYSQQRNLTKVETLANERYILPRRILRFRRYLCSRQLLLPQSRTSALDLRALSFAWTECPNICPGYDLTDRSARSAGYLDTNRFDEEF